RVQSERSPFPKNAVEAAAALGVDPNNMEGLFAYAPSALPRNARVADAGVPTIVLVYGSMGVQGKDPAVPYRIYHDLLPLPARIIRTEVLASNADAIGSIFRIDPRSQSGEKEPGPYRPGAELDTYRDHGRLRDLAPPSSGGNVSLSGPRVFV